ncbi:MAG TPA: hypothetical protein VJ798_07985 [Rhizomicrobium sp.]|nr:hypothetical protein [Rhizomicrobium sp.]
MIAIFIAGVATILVNDIFRKVLAIEDGLPAILLGSAPNFIAALTCPALVLLELPKLKALAHLPYKTLGLASGAVAFALLLLYELSQSITPNAVLDSNDMLATIAGAALWLIVWPPLNKVLPAAAA